MFFSFIIAFLIIFGIGMLIRSMIRKNKRPTNGQSTTYSQPSQSGQSTNTAPPTQASFCPNCGTKIDGNSAFCGNCGAKIK
jgi:membrane protease subunit (stomatin/prohibitin family)